MTSRASTCMVFLDPRIMTEEVINFLIEHQCPQCGAPAVLEETDRLFTCEFCRVRSYLMAKNYFRYQLPSTAPPNKDLIYFPYWRFKGMLFSCTPADVKFQFLDISRQAIPSRLMPVNVGFRSQALKLKFVSPESAGQFLKPQLTFDEVIQHFEERFSKSLPKPILHQSRVGDTVSLLYAPFYVEDRLFDAVLNKPITSNVPDDLNPVEFPGEKPDWQLHFVATLCPNCGWDLSGERDALVLLCKNCNSAWYPVGKNLKKLNSDVSPKKSIMSIIFLIGESSLRFRKCSCTLTETSSMLRTCPGQINPDGTKYHFVSGYRPLKFAPKCFCASPVV